MSLFSGIRDWVDRSWRGSNWRGLPLPGMIPFFAAFWFETNVVWALAWAWFALWSGFVAWRWWAYMKNESARADRAYDTSGKLRLSREYWDTESATSAKARKKRNG